MAWRCDDGGTSALGARTFVAPGGGCLGGPRGRGRRGITGVLRRFQAVTALFLLEGHVHTKHSALESSVHRHLVKSGRADVRFGQAFQDLRKASTIGDYGGVESVDIASARALIASARYILETVQRLSPTLGG